MSEGIAHRGNGSLQSLAYFRSGQAQYLHQGEHRALHRCEILEGSDESKANSFLDTETLFPRFGLPMVLFA